MLIKKHDVNMAAVTLKITRAAIRLLGTKLQVFDIQNNNNTRPWYWFLRPFQKQEMNLE